MTRLCTRCTRDDIDRLYLSRKEEGRGSDSIEDSVDALIRRLEDYIEKSRKRLITATRKNTNNTKIKRTTIRGAFNKFPDFFVLAFKIVVDN